MSGLQDGIIVDLSEYQGDVDFAKLSKVPNLKGVIIRVQAGSSHADTKYQQNVAGCKQYGIRFGTYAYFKGVSVSDAIQEAKDAYSRMDKASEEFAVDIEWNSCYDKTQLVPAGQAYIDHLKQQGLPKVGLYTGDYFFKPNGLDKLKVDFHWIASYGTNDGAPHNAPASPDDLWQFTSKGRIDGIQGYVDESISEEKPMSYFTGVVIKEAPTPIKQEAIAPAKPFVPAPFGFAVVTMHTVVRTGCSGSAPIIKAIDPGDIYKCYGYTNGWFNVGAGWIYGGISVFSSSLDVMKAYVAKMKS